MSFRKTSAAPELHKGLLSQIDSIFASGIDSKERLGTNKLDMEVVKDIKKLLVSWPKSQTEKVPKSSSAASGYAGSRFSALCQEKDKFTYFTMLKLSHRTTAELELCIREKTLPEGKKAVLGLSRRFVTLADPSNKDKLVGCWAMSSIRNFVSQGARVSIFFKREALHCWLGEAKEGKKVAQLICDFSELCTEVSQQLS